MKLSKLTRKHIIIIGIAILVVIAAGGYFALIKGARERYAIAVKDRDDAKAKSEQVPSVQAKYDRVYADHQRAERLLEAYYAAKMPYISVKDPVHALGQLWIEYGPNGMGPRIERWVRSTGNSGGGVALPDVRTDPPPTDTKEVQVAFNSFSIHTDSFASLMAFLRATQNMPRLGSIQKLKVSGQTRNSLQGTPGLNVDVPITVYVWTRDFTGAAATAPTQAAQANPASGAPPSGAQ